MNRQGPPLFEAPLAHESVQHTGACNCPECRANRELAFQAVGESQEADQFVTQMNLGVTRTKEGHEILTRIVADDVARSMPGIYIDREALLRGVTRPDKGTGSVVDSGRSIVHSVDADQQKRHSLRTKFNQSTADALTVIQGHLRQLQVQALDATLAGSPTIAFEMIGEALHLIQDSYSQAHTERTNINDINAPHPIRKIRFFGFVGLRPSHYPDEHQVIGYSRHVPFGDPRDDIHDENGNLKPEAQAAVNASREFLVMMLGQMARRPQPPYNGIELTELRAFKDWHLSTNPVHTIPSPVPPPGTAPSPSPRPSPSPSGGRPLLRRGSRGPSVSELQSRLNQWLMSSPRPGLQPLTVDGLFGPLTQSVVRVFQSSERLTADGIVGSQTWARLLRAQPHPTPPSPHPAPPQGFLKDSPALNNVPLAPETPIAINRGWPSLHRELASTYNRLGGLIQALTQHVGIDVPSVLAVWHIESGGLVHTVNRAVIRFENHLFYHHWGRFNENVYNQHFRFDPTEHWKHHQFRASTSEPFQDFHNNQAREYRVLNFAIQLAGENPALQSISIGGPQLLVSNYRVIGYTTPREMYDAFQRDERSHVLGFFDFCLHAAKPRPGDLINYLRAHHWPNFARYYNGPGQVQRYAKWLDDAYQQASLLSFS